jgi:hypothetical protein
MPRENFKQKINSGFHARGFGNKIDVVLKELTKNASDFITARFQINGLDDITELELKSGETKYIAQKIYLGITDPTQSAISQIYCNHQGYSIRAQNYPKS